jgi:hypothetical protein
MKTEPAMTAPNIAFHGTETRALRGSCLVKSSREAT